MIRLFFIRLSLVVNKVATHGLIYTLGAIRLKITLSRRYSLWVKKTTLSEEELHRQREEGFKIRPKISVIVPVYQTDVRFLEAMIRSVAMQSYDNWELCLADGGGTESKVWGILKSYADADPRIRAECLPENRGIAGNSNEAIALSSGEFVAFLDHDDMLPANALYEVIRTINAYPLADFIYTDEDKVSENGKKRFDPHFKPDWSPDNLRSHNYITHFTVIKRTLLEDIGRFRSGFEGSQDYDLILRATEKARQIIHIPKILYHWRVNLQSVAGNPFAKRYAYNSAIKAIEEHLERIGYQGDVENGQYLGTYKIDYSLPKESCVTIVVTSRQDANLHECICSIIEKSTYANYEIITEVPSTSLDGSGPKGALKHIEDPRVRFEIPHDLHGMPARMNYGGQRGRGDFLIFLDARTRVISPDWIERMLALAQRSDVGAVGGKLYYTNNEVALAGKIVGLNGNYGDCFRYSNRISPGYVNRLGIVQNYSAVSGACLMVKTETFLSIGGFEEKLSNLFYDVDLCLRLRSLDYLIVFTPFAEMYFCQNIKSHKNENLSVLMEMAWYKDEAGLFNNRWRSVLERGDPYYNPNLTTEKGYFPLKS